MMRMMQLGLYTCQRMFDFISLCFIVYFCVILRLFVIFCYFVKHLNLCYSVYPGPSETVRGSNFYYSWFLLLCFTLCPFVTKMGSNFYFLDRECISKTVK